MIRQATVQDIPELKRMWEKCYDDSLSYVDFLYEEVIDPKETLVFEEDGVLCSMASSMMCTFSYRSQSIKAVYIFGCATLPRYSWQGIQLQLISRLEQNARVQGAMMSVIVPSTRMHYRYFRDHGYRSEFPIRKLVLRPGALNVVPDPDVRLVFNELASETMYEIREEALREVPHIGWDAEHLEHIVRDAITYSETLASYEGEDGKAYALYFIKRGHMYVREALGTGEQAVKTLLAALIEHTSARRVHLRLPVDEGRRGKALLSREGAFRRGSVPESDA